MGFLLDVGGQGPLSFPVWEALMPPPHIVPSPTPLTKGRLQNLAAPRRAAHPGQRPTFVSGTVKRGQVEATAPGLELREDDVPTPTGHFTAQGQGWAMWHSEMGPGNRFRQKSL